MAGIKERVEVFLDSWPTIKEQLEEVRKDDERLFHSNGVSGSLPGEPEDDLPEVVGERDTGV